MLPGHSKRGQLNRKKNEIVDKVFTNNLDILFLDETYIDSEYMKNKYKPTVLKIYLLNSKDEKGKKYRNH